MSLPQLPALIGLGWNISRINLTSTRVLEAQSGVEYRAQNWASPKYKYTLPYTVLRQFAAYTEYNTLMGFILQQAGQFANWLYNDPFDNTATAQPIGSGDGNNTDFQLVRTVGGFTESVLYVNAVSSVSINGTPQSQSAYTVVQTGYYGPDTIQFNTAPAPGALITATFTFFFVCRFTSDAPEFNHMYDGRWEMKKLEFQTVK